jgi:hypothetical protein
MQDTVIVGEVEAGQAAQVRRSLKRAITQINTSTFDVVELLHRVRKDHLYTELSWSDFTKTLELKSSKALYLTRIGEVMDAIGCTRDQYEPIGVTKLRAITRLEPTDTYVNPITHEERSMSDYIKGLMEMAPETTADKLEQHVRVLMGETGENDFTWLNIRLPRLVMTNTIKPAMDKAAINLGTVAADAEGVAVEAKDWRKLEVLAVEYLNDSSTNPEVA